MRERSGSVSVLLIGDNGTLEEAGLTVLRREEISVVRARPEPETINLAQREQLDLIIIDVGPRSESDYGFELCRNLKSLPVTEDIPVVILVSAGSRDAAQQTRADAILYRPFLNHEFSEAVSRFTRLQERRHRRYPVNLRFRFSSSERRGQAFSRVMSAGGAFLKTDVPMPRGTRLELMFRLPGDDQEIRCIGVVRNTLGWDEAPDRTPGFGVEFEDLVPFDRQRLADFVASLRGRVGAR